MSKSFLSDLNDTPLDFRLMQPSVNQRSATIEGRQISPKSVAAYEHLIGRILAYRSNGVILVVSAIPGEGASTVARNTANALAASQLQRVVLVDADLRAPSQHTAFEMPLIDGLTDVLSGRLLAEAAVIGGQGSTASLLTAGRNTANPQHLLSRPALAGAVSALRSKFGWVIIDSPAVTRYPDAVCLARVADGAVLVVRAESTRWEVAEAAKASLEQAGIEIVCAVLNRQHHHIPEATYRRL